MSITRWDPFREIVTLREAMDRLFDESFVRPTVRPTGYILPVDVAEADDAVRITAAVPGVKPEELDVTVDGDVVRIAAETGRDAEREGERWLLRERRVGRFERTVRLPVEVDAGAAAASFDNGVLTLTLPKAASARPRQIKVNVASAA